MDKSTVGGDVRTSPKSPSLTPRASFKQQQPTAKLHLVIPTSGGQQQQQQSPAAANQLAAAAGVKRALGNVPPPPSPSTSSTSSRDPSPGRHHHLHHRPSMQSVATVPSSSADMVPVVVQGLGLRPPITIKKGAKGGYGFTVRSVRVYLAEDSEYYTIQHMVASVSEHTYFQVYPVCLGTTKLARLRSRSDKGRSDYTREWRGDSEHTPSTVDSSIAVVG
jgi:hypothetical protein